MEIDGVIESKVVSNGEFKYSRMVDIFDVVYRHK